jgi:1,2-diacylglycerol 3-alpha-glucosyltransferase
MRRLEPASRAARHRISTGLQRATPTAHAFDRPCMHVAVIWQRFLPYHVARVRRLRERFAPLGYRLTAIEVASQDATYGFDSALPRTGFEHLCCFPGASYHDHRAARIHAKVLAALTEARPDVVFAPATPFPEGMAAVEYRRRSGCRMFMMDDAWEHTDRRGALVRWVKSLIHRNIDGAFIPAATHAAYYRTLGFPDDRIIYGVDVVDNDAFSIGADRARANGARIEVAGVVLDDYFLFVGRFAPKKGLQTLLPAYARYRERAAGKPWDLVVVGGGRGLKEAWNLGAGIDGLHFAGPQHGDDLYRFYGKAKALIVSSEMDQWGLVVNEGLAAGLPVIVCTGCGAARTLVLEGENGWCFPRGDIESLTKLLLHAAASPPETLARMGVKSREIIAVWSLDRFADGVLQAMQLPRSGPAGFLSDVATRLWKGRVSIN